ncbi:ABC transporter [Anoxybacter fermentans]|uniref:ABC transporter n=2 Tax=Anoxybacter fermentans TaxID=1323375 RepID=A0A3Q9HNS3_9FIRM|nr:ABC transporter [Anoxybacter fermentans]
MNMGTPSIEVTDLKKYFGSVKAVDGISFQVEAGTIFGMLGPNGAGKSTTVETMVGLNKRDGGKISILGLDPEKNPEELKSKIGVQLQSPSLFPRLTVKEIVNLFASFYSDPLSADEVIARVGLEAKVNEQIKNLSGGQRHRLAIALAMVGNGKVIFLDEPTTGLDPQARRQLWDVILQLKEEGVTVFLTTHYMDEAEKLCDHLVIIDHGKIIAQGSPRELINQYFKERAVEFVDPGFSKEERDELKRLDIANRISYEQEEKHIILYTDEISRTITRLMEYAAGIDKPIDDIIVRHATLEDVFLKLTGRGIRE